VAVDAVKGVAPSRTAEGGKSVQADVQARALWHVATAGPASDVASAASVVSVAASEFAASEFVASEFVASEKGASPIVESAIGPSPVVASAEPSAPAPEVASSAASAAASKPEHTQAPNVPLLPQICAPSAPPPHEQAVCAPGTQRGIVPGEVLEHAQTAIPSAMCGRTRDHQAPRRDCDHAQVHVLSSRRRTTAEHRASQPRRQPRNGRVRGYAGVRDP
jgi:hypothetical protein